LLALIAQPATARVHLGALAGLTRTSLNGDAPLGASYKHRLGFAGGLIGEVDLPQGMRLSIQPMFQQRGTTVAYEVEGEKDPRDSLSVRLDYVSVPVLLKVFSASGRMYATGGFEFGILQSATLANLNADVPDEDAKNLFQDVDVALAFGLGGVFPFDRWSLWVEGRYSQSIPNLSRSGEDPETKGLPERFRATGLQLYVGVDLPLGQSASAAEGDGR
jgi:hypothetical protein